MRTFDKKKASLSQEIKPGFPEGYTSEETTHYSVVDREGNAVAATTTLTILLAAVSLWTVQDSCLTTRWMIFQ